jgi:uncharacterized protein YydD (DUF2326 family)
MILLNRLYSDTHLFDEVKFNKGINIVLGKYSGEKRSQDINGIGKSTLVRLIDFAFLSKAHKEYFSVKKYKFLEGHNFTLEFMIDGVIYQIKREFEDSKMVWYGKQGDTLEKYTEAELRDILQNKFFNLDDYEGDLGNTWFRPLMRFFIKDDINHHERTDPLNFIHKNRPDLELIIYNFFLLGLPNRSLVNFNISRKEKKELRKTSTQLEKKILEDTGKNADEFRSEIIQIENRVTTLEKGLEKYKFLENYKHVEDRLIELSSLISNELKRFHVLDRKLKEFKESHRFELEADIQKVKTIYSEIEKSLGEYISKKLDEVIVFRKEIVENRKRFLVEREKKLEVSIEQILKKISGLEEERRRLYKMLDERDALDSIKNSYQQLIDEKAKLQENKLSIKQIQEIEVEISQLNTRLSEINTKVINGLHQADEALKNLTSLFFDIISHAIFVDKDTEGAYFTIKPGANRESPAKIKINIPKSESLGKSRFKILAYDLLVFFNIIKSTRRLPHFLIHDGVFHTIGPKTVVNTLNYINSQSLIYPNFQYIITVNENEIYLTENQKVSIGDYDFDWEEMVVVKYEDVPKEMIFKQEYS